MNSSHFFKYLGETLHQLPQIKLNRSLEQDVQKSVLKMLNMSDMGKLRDRYDSQTYLDKQMMKIGAYFSCLKYFNLEKPEITPQLLKTLDPKITLGNKQYNLIIFEYGKLPIMKDTHLENDVVFVLQKNSSIYTICGVADSTVLSDNSNLIKKGNKSEFIGFNKLHQITNNPKI